MTDQKLKRSATVTFRLREDEVVGANPRVGSTRKIPGSLWQVLRGLGEWTDRATVVELLHDATGDTARSDVVLQALLSEGFLVEEGTPADQFESAFSRGWPFGETTAGHHLVTRSLSFSDDRTEAFTFGKALRRHAADDLAPETPPSADEIPLPAPRVSEALVASLARRRSRRDFLPVPVSAEQLSSVLWVTAGIQGFQRPAYRPPLPLMFAPSPGGLNGIDCYVLVADVEGLETGAYRYRPRSEALERLGDQRTLATEHLLGNQRWAGRAGAVVVLVGNASRTAWKYDAASGFNALLLQAGHMAQNALLAAADVGLGAVTSNAIHAEDMESALGLQPGREIVLSSVSMGFVDGDISLYEEYLDSDMSILAKMAKQ
ncbi:SagB/ThcOx family dehydrogenase [Frigoribacterium sp. CFBP9030]|uniref:SagB/ThcOx family dehydrogenase n=1 Tax=Frigoribacterium sp. CFBP9030 TaxID=3096537 RepID=UPI002A6B3C06|nr:SagB/ThcOx family dehydrogenase [Frigoribacterium sp. CFBP9030]MDY0891663.1 SagB/ThcOx family dehydrogenase [Frigoribacterium sp. CFBP9030]